MHVLYAVCVCMRVFNTCSLLRCVPTFVVVVVSQSVGWLVGRSTNKASDDGCGETVTAAAMAAVVQLMIPLFCGY